MIMNLILVIWITSILQMTNNAILPIRSAILVYQDSPLEDRHRGKVYIKEITIEGASLYTNNEMILLSGLKVKEMVDDKGMNRALQRIKGAYFDRGFIRINISVTQELVMGPVKKGIPSIKLIIRINEGISFFIRRIEFIGNNETSHTIVQKATGLRIHDPYNPSRIDDWIRGLNRLKLFEKIRSEDVEITINEQEHYVDMLFKLKEIKTRGN